MKAARITTAKAGPGAAVYTSQTRTGARKRRTSVSAYGIPSVKRRVASKSVLREIIIQLPLGDLTDVVLPLLSLGRKELCRDVFAQCLRNHFVLLELGACL